MNLQHKINTVVRFIYMKKGINIGTIKFSQVNADRELQMLDYAYSLAIK